MYISGQFDKTAYVDKLNYTGRYTESELYIIFS